MQTVEAREELLSRARSISPDEFEVLCSLVLGRTLRTTELSVTPRSQDGGIDIEGRLSYDWFAADYGVQVKRYAEENTVGSDRVHRLAGALLSNNYHLGTFITTSSYTKPAVAASNQLPV
ncbi:restriction endonuclease [Halorarum halophilum]|uniref:Restriction endonuclease n=1 Tax=Halorarum halophilum TaxID=2743090 RepID=A0A7D5KH15_9EURY|nr:restriction endonuclease [Halobaculum halophilum]QLG28736.1 restriction endonuclease [Halobaculum halophilum]